MAVFLDRIDAAPLADDDFSFSFDSWISVTIDTLNEIIIDIQNQFNGVGTPYGPTTLTQAQIIALAPNLNDGVFLYCTDHVPPVYVGKINGALVQFTTTPFP
jgi:hypothetical protein